MAALLVPANNVVNPVTSPNSFTTNYITQVYQLLLTQQQDPAVASAWQNIEIQQKALAKQLIDRTPACNIPMLNSLRDHISGLQATALKDVITDQFYNPQAMAATMCAVDSIFYAPPSDIGSAFLNDRIRLYIHNLRQIGSESVEGYALLGDFENAKNLFVVKVSRNPEDDSLLHELIVGLFGTNKLRQSIPNFSYIYGGFKCSPPLINPEEKKVVTWCLNSNNPVNYVLYENIAPATELADYVKTCTGKEFVNAYLQILYALRLAVSLIKFTHYDLHYKNVLIRRLANMAKRSFQIAYETERGLEYLTTQFVATIIDYGFSHITTEQGYDFGKSGFVPFSVYPDRPWIIHDLYKLLMFSTQAAMAAGNESVVVEASKIFRFFNTTEDIRAAVATQINLFFTFPLTEETQTLSVDGLAQHTRTVCDCDFISTTRSVDPVLDCEALCPTETEVLTQIGVNPNGPIKTPATIFEFFDLFTRLQTQNREGERQQIYQTFSYSQAIVPHLRKMEAILRDLSSLRRQLKLIDLEPLPAAQVLNYNTMMLVRTMYFTVAAMVDRVAELEYYYNAGTAIAAVYNDTKSINTIQGLISRYEQTIKPAMDEARAMLRRDAAVITRLQSDPLTVPAVQQDPRLQWYWDGLKLFDKILGV
jgi:hypothetical protein